MTRRGRFAPAQWVLSRLPCSLATMGDQSECLDVGALQAHDDGPRTFGIQSRYRAKAREAFVPWDCGERVRRGALRKAAPVVGSDQVGDIVSYCREPRAGVQGPQWSAGSRLIGFEKDQNSLDETQPRTCWVICDLCPITASSHVSSLRPDDDTQEQLIRSAKQDRTTKNAVETLQDVSKRGIEWISSSENGRYASKRQEESVEEARR